MWVVNSPTPKWIPIGFDNHSHVRGIPHVALNFTHALDILRNKNNKKKEKQNKQTEERGIPHVAPVLRHRSSPGSRQFECPFFQSSHIAAREAEVGKWKFGPATTILKPKRPGLFGKTYLLHSAWMLGL